MKKALLLFALTAMIGYSWAYDFSAVAPSGQILYYHYLNNNSAQGEVELVYPGTFYGGYIYPTGNLVIPDTVYYNGNQFAVKGIGERALYAYTGYRGLVSVVVPRTVTNIGNMAFYGCVDLVSVTIHNTLQIGNNAFYGCTALGSIELPDSLLDIGFQAFYGCTSLDTLVVPHSVLSIGSNAFWGINTIYYFGDATGAPWGAVNHNKYYYEEDGLYYVDTTKTFLCGCSETLTNVVVPNSVVKIGENTFANKINIVSVTMGNNVTLIGNRAFFGCTALNTITIPNSVISLGNDAFNGCSTMTSISFGSNLNAIGDGTFSGCTGLSSITIPSGITYIGNSAFSGCTGLSSVTIPSGITYLGNGAFSGCDNITTVNYNAEECRNGGGSFMGLSSLTTLNMGNNVRYIPSNMFKNCTGLVTVRIPDAVTEIGSGAFQGCVNLTNATLGSGLTSISNNCFEDCLRLMNVRLGDAVSSIGANAFRNCGIVGELVIPQGVISIGERAFFECYGINSITALGRVAPILENDYSDKGPFYGVDSNIVVNNPCGTTNMYAGRWPQFHNFSEMPFLFNAISENISKGTVTVEQEPTCDNPYALIRATPKVGYHFDHWSDGNTSNPYSYTATGSVTLIAYFAENVGIASAKLDDNGISITVENGQIVVHGDYTGLVRVFEIMGRLVASAKAGDALPAMPNGVYIVQIGKTIAKKVVILR